LNKGKKKKDMPNISTDGIDIDTLHLTIELTPPDSSFPIPTDVALSTWDFAGNQ